MTLNLVKGRLWKGGTCTKPVPLGQAQPVPLGQAQPVPLGLGKVKRDLSLSHGTRHIPTLEAFPCPMGQALYHDAACPCPTCPNLSHKVGLQGRESFAFTARPSP